MARTWSQSDLDFLRDNYKKMSYAEIAAKLGTTVGKVKSQAANYGITTTRKWPEDHIAVLRDEYSEKPAREIAERLGRGLSSVHGMAKKLGLKKADDWHNRPESGRMNLALGVQKRFQKGLTPWNKGKKIGSHPNSVATQFQKGGRPHNAVPVGTEVVSTDGYRKIKVAEPNVWEFVHRREWERHHGPISPGMMVRFRDGDNMNCDIGNLMLITRTEHALYNSQWDIPAEVVPAMAVLSELNKELKNAEEKQNGRSA